jgi:hypothetical protein
MWHLGNDFEASHIPWKLRDFMRLAKSLSILINLFNTIDWWNLVPDQNLWYVPVAAGVP